MKKTTLLLLSIAALALAGCNNKPTTEAPQKQAAPQTEPAQMPPGHPAVTPDTGGADPHAGMKAQAMPAGAGIKAKVTQVLSAPGKTFLEVADEKGQKMWLAMPEVKVSVGNTVEYPKSPSLPSFHSKTLNRDFENISFISAIRVVK
ncbi:MAG: hypothetical protein HXX11_20060 [Desulfuromonadales bacterium]|nr:hypothetical protein [Desulfuromonadales bacterium]